MAGVRSCFGQCQESLSLVSYEHIIGPFTVTAPFPIAILITTRPPCLYHFGHCWSLHHVSIWTLGWLRLHHSFSHSIIPSVYKYYVKAYFSCSLPTPNTYIHGCATIPEVPCPFHHSVWNHIHYRCRSCRRLHGGRREQTHTRAGRRRCPCSSNQAHETTFAVFRVQASDTECLCERLAAPKARTGWG